MGLNRYKDGRLINDLDVQGILRFIEVADSGVVYISASNGIHKFNNNYQKWSEVLCPHNDIGKLCEARAFVMKSQNDI